IFGVSQYHPSPLGERHLFSNALEQRIANLLLQCGDLTADGLRREMEIAAGGRDTAVNRHAVEVVQVVVVERRHKQLYLREQRARKPSIFGFYEDNVKNI